MTMSWNIVYTTSGKKVVYYCSDKYVLDKVKDFNSNEYDNTTSEWMDVLTHIRKLAGKEAKKMLVEL